jgi:hypothetical protein
MGARGPKPRKNCSKGHPMSGENLVIARRGNYTERQCRACKRAASRKWWRENRSSANERKAS